MPLLYWLDTNEQRYLGPLYVLLYGLAALAVAGFVSVRADRRLSSRWGTFAFFCVAALALLAGRWPSFFVREELNIDEAGMLALANQMIHFPVPWVDYDPQTVGPLDALVLNAPRLLWITPGWISTRIVAVGVWLVATGGLYAASALLFEARVARLAVIPAVLFFATVYERDFLHYSSELLPAALTVWAVYFLLRAARDRSAGPIAACALLAGSLTFAKLQAAPIAATLFVLLVVTIAGWDAAPLRVRARRLLLALGMTAVVPALVLVPVGVHAALRDVWISYILSGINYIWNDYLPPSFVLGETEFGPFFDGSALIALQAVWLSALAWRGTGGVQRLAPFVLGAVLAAALVAIYVPKHGSAHYLLLAAFPVATCAALALGLAARRVAGIAGAPSRAAATALLAVGFLAATCAALPWLPRTSPYIGWLTTAVERPLDPTAAALDYWVGIGKRVAIWGWAPNQWVHSQTLMGTRDLLCEHQIDPGPYRTYFRQRYLADFIAARPAGFLDAVTPDSFGFYDQKKDGFESFPALAAVVGRDYELVAVIGKGFRVYLRRDVVPRSP